MPALIIHRKVTCCQSSIKQPQIKMKIGVVIKNQHDKVKYDIHCQY